MFFCAVAVSGFTPRRARRRGRDRTDSSAKLAVVIPDVLPHARSTHVRLCAISVDLDEIPNYFAIYGLEPPTWGMRTTFGAERSGDSGDGGSLS